MPSWLLAHRAWTLPAWTGGAPAWTAAGFGNPAGFHGVRDWRLAPAGHDFGEGRSHAARGPLRGE
jgi:hypothetical protein